MNDIYKNLESFTFFMAIFFRIIFVIVILFNLEKLKTLRIGEVLIILAICFTAADVCGIHIIARSNF